MSLASTVAGVAIIILLIFCFVLFKKRIVAIFIDMVIITAIYIGILFLLGWFNILVSSTIAGWSYPALLIGFIIYHIIISLNGRKSRYNNAFGVLK